MRPSQAELDFFEQLAPPGEGGPILELPFNPNDIDQSSRAVLLASYHRRRTSQCFNSYIPPEVTMVKAISDRLPDESAIRELAELGFTTIVIHPDPVPGERTYRRHWHREFERMPATRLLRRIARDDARVAFEIVAESSAADELRDAE
jgi:hypothetical protein